MAEQMSGPAETGAAMDYSEHEKTYALFLAGAKYGTIVIVVALLIAMAAYFFTGCRCDCRLSDCSSFSASAAACSPAERSPRVGIGSMIRSRLASSSNARGGARVGAIVYRSQRIRLARIARCRVTRRP
jgi:hypothetical protein